jgi:hypothetical protein
MRLVLEEMLKDLQARGDTILIQPTRSINVPKLIRQLQDDNPAGAKLLRLEAAPEALLHLTIPRTILHSIEPNRILLIKVDIPLDKSLDRSEVALYQRDE